MRRPRNRQTRWIALSIVCLLAASGILHRQELAALYGRVAHDRTETIDWVDDRVALLVPAQRARVADYHAALADAHDIDYRVLTLDDGGDINLRAHAYFNDTGVGDASGDGRGLLLVVDTVLDQVRLEVSSSLEGVYTDAFVAYVQHRQMLPFFRSGRVADGILATTELIVARAQEAAAGHAFSPPMPSESRGGGATAAIDAASDTTRGHRQQMRSIDADGRGPVQVVAAYHDAMARRDARPDLPIYSRATARMLADWTVTPAQMDNVAKTYRACERDGVSIDGGRAVVRYRVSQRQCAPYFLSREDGAWKLDLTVMSSLVRFNHNNEWHLRPRAANPYAFAFEDWRFDRRGFPHASR